MRTGHVWRGLLTAALFAVLVGAAALVFTPDAVAPAENALAPVSDAVEGLERTQLLMSIAGVVGAMAALVVAIQKLSGGEPAPRLVDGGRPPEATSVDPATVSGYTADRAIAAVESLDDARTLRDDLRETAIDALRTAGEPREDARRRIERGEWTDDDLAAGFLGDTVPVPLLARLRGWLDGGAEGRRRLRRSVDAVAALAADSDAVAGATDE